MVYQSWHCLKKKTNKLFGCIRSYLCHAGSFVGSHGLYRCSAQAQLPCRLWYLSSPTSERTCVRSTARQILNHWTTRGVPPLWHFVILARLLFVVGWAGSVLYRNFLAASLASAHQMPAGTPNPLVMNKISLDGARCPLGY